MCIYLPVKPWGKSSLKSPRNYDKHDTMTFPESHTTFSLPPKKRSGLEKEKQREEEWWFDTKTQPAARHDMALWNG